MAFLFNYGGHPDQNGEKQTGDAYRRAVEALRAGMIVAVAPEGRAATMVAYSRVSGIVTLAAAQRCATYTVFITGRKAAQQPCAFASARISTSG